MSSTKTTGALFKQFYADPKTWGTKGNNNDWYIDDLFIIVNGVDEDMDTVHGKFGDNLDGIADDATVKIDTGYLCWQGKGSTSDDGKDLGDAFNAWLKERNVISLMATLDVPKDIDPVEFQRIVAILEGLGAKVQGVPEQDRLVNEAEVAALNQAVQSLVQAPSPSQPSRRRAPR